MTVHGAWTKAASVDGTVAARRTKGHGVIHVIHSARSRLMWGELSSKKDWLICGPSSMFNLSETTQAYTTGMLYGQNFISQQISCIRARRK